MSEKEENLNEINNKPRDSTLPPPGAAGSLEDVVDNKKNEEKQGNLDEIEDLNLMKEALDEFGNTSKSCGKLLFDLSQKFIEKNNNFFEEIKKYMNNLSTKYIDMFKLNEKQSEEEKLGSLAAFKSIIGKNILLINKILEKYTQIYDSVKQNLEIMLSFLNISKKLGELKPIQEFFSDEFNNIVKSWLFMKIDFEKFDFNKALNKCDIDSNFKNFITKVCTDKNFIMKITCPRFEATDPKQQKILAEKKKSEIKQLTDNKSNLIKLNMENVGSVRNYISDDLEFVKLKSFFLKNSTIQGGNLFKQMKNLEKLNIQSCPSVQIDILDNIPTKLKKLYLEKNNFVNQDFVNIVSGILSQNKNILQNLELLSFAGNNLTKIDFQFLSPKVKFQSLKELNFKKNKITKFIFVPENFPEIKFINCCKNHLNRSYLSSIKNLTSLESANGFLFHPKLCKKYYGDLKNLLTSNQKNIYRMKYLNISFMPKIQSLEYFSNFDINEEIMIHLKKLDLSYNGLDCASFLKFLDKNKGFINLRSLNLNGNEIDDTFFEKLLNQDVFSKLQHLYLNDNKIGDFTKVVNYKDDIPIDAKYKDKNEKQLVYKLRLLYQFIQNNKYLSKLTITKNPISEYYTVIPEKNNDADKSDKYIKRDENGNIIINCLFSFCIKIRDELLTKEEEKAGRNTFNLRFDCRSNVNKNSENYPYSDKPFIYKK